MGMAVTIDTLALSVVHVALAACVTGHVLLTKRNVGSSIAWIGLAWLSPMVGSILYVLFGINRVRARAIFLKEKRPKRGSVRPLVRHDGHRRSPIPARIDGRSDHRTPG